MIKTPIYQGLLQSDLDVNHFNLLNYSGGGGGGGTGLPEGWVSVKDYAGKGDAKLVTDAAMTSGSHTLTSATAAFTSADVGKAISVNGVGASGAILLTTISGFTNSTTVTLTAAAGTTASAQYCAFGTDNTTPAQNALAVAKSVVYFPPGNYFFAGSIGAVPANVSVMGAPFLGPHGNVVDTGTLYVPSNHLSPMAGGTCFLLTANPGIAGGQFISLSDNSSVTGITFYWPNQLPTAGTPTPYPWAIYLGTGAASSVKYCNFVNAYMCIYIENTTFSLIEEIRGQALYRGIRCEGNYDVTRLRGVHFNASWSTTGPGAWQLSFGTAFEFGRNDLLIAESCFAFWYGTWAHFYNDAAHNIPPAGGGGPTASWAQIRGGGADWCTKPIWLEQAQPQGVDIDGAHISNNNPASNPCVTVGSANTGSLRIHNSMMLGWDGRFGTVDGTGEVMVDNIHFLGTGPAAAPPVAFGTTGWAVTGTGNFTMRDCTFRTTQTHVSLGASLTRAVVTGNLCSDTFNVTNSIGAKAVISNNTVTLSTFTVATLPASPVTGQTAAVSDGTASLAWGATVTGGGSTKYLVWWQGANWTVIGK